MQLTRSCLCQSTRLIPSKACPTLQQTAMIWTSKGLQIRLHVKPNSKTDGILDVREDSVHVAVSWVARNGEANRGIIDLMSRVLGVKKNQATLVAGRKSRDKIMLVNMARQVSIAPNRCKDMTNIIAKLKQAIVR